MISRVLITGYLVLAGCARPATSGLAPEGRPGIVQTQTIPTPGVWAQPGGNARRTGSGPVEGPAKPRLQWTSSNTASIGGTRGSFGPVLYSDGTVVGVDGQTASALRPDGKRRWIYHIPDGEMADSCSLAVGKGGMVYIPTQRVQYCLNPSLGRNAAPGLHAVDAHGRLVWKYSEAEATSSPIIGRNGHVYLGTINREVVEFTPHGAVIRRWPMPTSTSILGSLALWEQKTGVSIYGAADGAVWLARGDGSSAHRTLAQPADALGWVPGLAVDEKRKAIYVLFSSGVLYALDAGDLSVKWKLRLPGEVRAPLALGETSIYAGGADIWDAKGTSAKHHHIFYRIDYQGIIRRRIPLISDLSTAPAIDAKGRVYLTQVAEGSPEEKHAGYLYCLNAGGDVLWKFPLSPDESEISAPVLGPGKTIYCVGRRAY